MCATRAERLAQSRWGKGTDCKLTENPLSLRGLRSSSQRVESFARLDVAASRYKKYSYRLSAEVEQQGGWCRGKAIRIEK